MVKKSGDGATPVTRTHISDHLLLAVKDQLRNVRYRLRRSARPEGQRALRFTPHVPLPVALAANAVFSQVEAAASAFMPEQQRQANASFPQPISAYVSPRAEEEKLFVPEIYYALKGLLRRFGLSLFLVSEQAVDEALSSFRSLHGDLIRVVLNASRSPAERSDAAVRLSAALAAELAAVHPVREIVSNALGEQAPKNLSHAPNDYCALTLGLAIALASKDNSNGDLDALVNSADLAVDARFAELSAALRSGDPTAALAQEFAAMTPFLP